MLELHKRYLLATDRDILREVYVHEISPSGLYVKIYIIEDDRIVWVKMSELNIVEELEGEGEPQILVGD